MSLSPHDSVYDAFAAATASYGDHPFLYLVTDTAARYGVESGAMTYAEADREVSRLIGGYRAFGWPAGSRVALGLDNRPESFTHWLALNALGLSVVPLNPQWQSAELEYVLEHSEAHAAVVLPQYAQAVMSARDQVNPNCTVFRANEVRGANASAEFERSPGAECALLYTSGTTGKPKGCMLSNEYYLATGQWYADVGGYCELHPGKDRLVTPLPMYHMNAMATSTMAMILTGSCIVPLDRFHPTTWWQSVAECDATIIHYLGVMPAMLMSLPEAEHDRSHTIRFGFGAGLSGELHTAFEDRFGISLIEAWAMTETGGTIAVIASHEPRKVGTACFGRPPAHLDYRLVDDDGHDVALGTPGELLVRRAGDESRAGFYTGYLKDEKATKEAWTGGYFRTGDLVYVDDDGLMHFVDRKKNVIRRSGENISAVEVEEVVLEHPAVNGVGVAAVPDDVRGDEVFACILSHTTDDTWDEVAKSITAHCLERLAYYKAPAYLARVEALPLTATAKIQRVGLKALACELLTQGQCIDNRAMKVRRG